VSRAVAGGAALNAVEYCQMCKAHLKPGAGGLGARRTTELNPMKTSIVNYLTAFVTVSVVLAARAGNWPGGRGPAGTGVSAEKGLPQTWSTNENVRGRVALPGPGNSSPIVWGNRVFITQAVKSENRRTVMCFDRANGKLLWQSGPTYAEQEPTQESNPYCAATPVTDGERVIASFGSAGLYCDDFEGKELWQRDLGRMNHMFGNAASPILHGDLCVLNFGPGAKGSSWSSMLLAEGKIYLPNQSGDVFVLRASPKFEILATNSVGEPTNASLAASDGALFLRTDSSLWCFASVKQ